MSSPQNTTMLGLFCAWTTPETASAASSATILQFIDDLLLLESEYLLPVTFHADHHPVARHGGVQCLVQLADVRLPVVRGLARAVVVMHDESEPPALARARELQHLQVTI